MIKSKSNVVHINAKENDPTIRALIGALASRNSFARQEAREELVAMGPGAVDYLAELLEHPKDIMRWECVKALGQIADPGSVPLLIPALSDDNEEVRWLSAEGLVAIGPPAVKPVLEELLRHPKSLRIRRGVHHVLTGLRAEWRMIGFDELIGALDGPEAKLHAPVAANKVLKRMRHVKAGRRRLYPHTYKTLLREMNAAWKGRAPAL